MLRTFLRSAVLVLFVDVGLSRGAALPFGGANDFDSLNHGSSDSARKAKALKGQRRNLDEKPPITQGGPKPTPAPAPSPEPSCFSGRNLVEVQSKGHILIEELQLGDMVRSKDDYTEVYAFAYRDASAEREFIQLVTASEKEIELTPHHMVELANQESPTPAKDVKVGDSLVLSSPYQQETVSEVNVVKGKGLYSPLTVDGLIAVNGIVASNYAVFGESVMLAQPRFYHWALAPLRFVCFYLSRRICSSPRLHDTNRGMHLYVSLGEMLGGSIFAKHPKNLTLTSL